MASSNRLLLDSDTVNLTAWQSLGHTGYWSGFYESQFRPKKISDKNFPSVFE
jgi:hypothetical protein